MQAAKRSMAVQVRAMLDFWEQGVPTLDYGNNIRQMAQEMGVHNAFDFPGFVPAYIRPLFCRGVGPFRWAALSGDPEDIYRTDEKVKALMPDNPHLHNWLDMARRRIRFQGLPSRICWVGLGEGEATCRGRTLPGAAALAAAGLAPIELAAKEGLALINGTQFSTAHALSALFAAWRNAEAAVVTSCLSTDAMMGSTEPLHPAIHALRGHAGQIDVARAMRTLMSGSAIRESHREGDPRVQDAYCIRCQPQVTGACVDLLRQAARTLTIEANAVTDNPLVLGEGDGDGAVSGAGIFSGGNFHAEPVAFAADQIALAIAEMGSIAQRRVALMVDPTLSHDLPPFLTPEPGLNSGFMSAEVTTAALMSENKHLANPCSTDSTPTSANQEDHVSMAAHGARRLAQMNANLANILGVELLCAAQGIEFRAPLATSVPLGRVIERLRREVPSLGSDRPLAPDLARAARLVSTGELVDATGSAPMPGL